MWARGVLTLLVRKALTCEPGVWAAETIEAKLSDGEAGLAALSSPYPV